MSLFELYSVIIRSLKTLTVKPGSPIGRIEQIYRMK